VQLTTRPVCHRSGKEGPFGSHRPRSIWVHRRYTFLKHPLLPMRSQRIVKLLRPDVPGWDDLLDRPQHQLPQIWGPGPCSGRLLASTESGVAAQLNLCSGCCSHASKCPEPNDLGCDNAAGSASPLHSLSTVPRLHATISSCGLVSDQSRSGFGSIQQAHLLDSQPVPTPVPGTIRAIPSTLLAFSQLFAPVALAPLRIRL
jgi:hypothetical protein